MRRRARDRCQPNPFKPPIRSSLGSQDEGGRGAGGNARRDDGDEIGEDQHAGREQEQRGGHRGLGYGVDALGEEGPQLPSGSNADWQPDYGGGVNTTSVGRRSASSSITWLLKTTSPTSFMSILRSGATAGVPKPGWPNWFDE